MLRERYGSFFKVLSKVSRVIITYSIFRRLCLGPDFVIFVISLVRTFILFLVVKVIAVLFGCCELWFSLLLLTCSSINFVSC